SSASPTASTPRSPWRAWRPAPRPNSCGYSAATRPRAGTTPGPARRSACTNWPWRTRRAEPGERGTSNSGAPGRCCRARPVNRRLRPTRTSEAAAHREPPRAGRRTPGPGRRIREPATVVSRGPGREGRPVSEGSVTQLRERVGYLEKRHGALALETTTARHDLAGALHREGRLREAEEQYELAFQGLSRRFRSEEPTSELQSRENLVCRLLLD